ncbi:MAG: DsrE family protein [Candidatus Bathyarchaeota archaeon]|nr:DsrE family protein [Candidatus Bathyarchaeota archaeon]
MVEKKKTLGLMLFTSPYGSQDADHMCRIALAALKKGYGVEIFLYGDGVHAQLKGQDPQCFYNVGEALEKIVELGGVIKSCVRCSQARGYVDGGYNEKEDRYESSKALDAVRIYSLYGFIDMIKHDDKLITFGSS